MRLRKCRLCTQFYSGTTLLQSVVSRNVVAGQRYAGRQQATRIHGIANDMVGTAGSDSLASLDLNGARGKAVDF